MSRLSDVINAQNYFSIEKLGLISYFVGTSSFAYLENEIIGILYCIIGFSIHDVGIVVTLLC